MKVIKAIRDHFQMVGEGYDGSEVSQFIIGVGVILLLYFLFK